MTQTPAVAVAPVAPSAARPDPVEHLDRTAVEDVPSLLNRWQAVSVGICVVFGLLVALLQGLGWQANGRAADNTEQLVRVQQIQSSLFRADALAANAFLVGGLEPTEQRAEYDAALDRVLRLIAAAADAQPADRDALAELNVQVAAYATDVAQARDGNRLGLPVGASYLTVAGERLRDDALPIVAALVDANADRANQEFQGQRPIWILLIGLAALGGLWWVNGELARRFRRRINVGVAIAAAGVLVVTVVAVGFAATRSSSNSDIQDGAYISAVTEATARTAANDAKANESRRLIQRGSGQGFEDAWVFAQGVVDENVSAQTAVLWDDYVAEHEAIVALDEAGNWDKAVAAATTLDGGSTLALNHYDQAAQQVVDQNSAEATDGLRSGGAAAIVLMFLTLLIAVIASGAATWGINERRKEYS